MSNVTLGEIIDLTAREFDLLPWAFRGELFGVGEPSDRPKPLRARQIAIYLAMRHTMVTPAELAAVLGQGRKGAPARMLAQVRLIEAELAAGVTQTREAVERIEAAIDLLHERPTLACTRSFEPMGRGVGL